MAETGMILYMYVSQCFRQIFIFTSFSKMFEIVRGIIDTQTITNHLICVYKLQLQPAVTLKRINKIMYPSGTKRDLL